MMTVYLRLGEWRLANDLSMWNVNLQIMWSSLTKVASTFWMLWWVTVKRWKLKQTMTQHNPSNYSLMFEQTCLALGLVHHSWADENEDSTVQLFERGSWYQKHSISGDSNPEVCWAMSYQPHHGFAIHHESHEFIRASGSSQIQIMERGGHEIW